ERTGPAAHAAGSFEMTNGHLSFWENVGDHNEAIRRFFHSDRLSAIDAYPRTVGEGATSENSANSRWQAESFRACSSTARWQARSFRYLGAGQQQIRSEYRCRSEARGCALSALGESAL